MVRSIHPTSQVNNDEFAHKSILDSCTKWIIMDRPTWSICCKHIKTLSMSAVDESMKETVMQCYNAVIDVCNRHGQMRLFGIRRGAYLATFIDDEAVVNNHYAHKEGW
eukprot:11658590-Ditylum_brightwellii.AAC.1